MNDNLTCGLPDVDGTITGMNNHAKILIAVTALTFLGGCGGDMGILLRPVDVKEQLEETTIGGDDGWFIANKIAIVDVDGIIVNMRERGMFGGGENPVSLFVEKLDTVADDSNIRAVIVRINSPGGGVTASDIMYRALTRFRATHNIPVVAIIEDVGASGGYYIACGADRILAHPTSVTGSIGVISQMMSLAGTLRMLGVETKAVTSGPMKDMGSMFKPLDDKDLAVMQVMIDAFYERFVGVVAASRTELTTAQVRKLADGRIYTGPQAKANGLVDDLGYMDDAFELAKTLAGISRARMVVYARPYGYRANAYSAAPGAAPQINMINISLGKLADASRPRFMYLWTGRGGGK